MPIPQDSPSSQNGNLQKRHSTKYDSNRIAIPKYSNSPLNTSTSHQNDGIADSKEPNGELGNDYENVNEPPKSNGDSKAANNQENSIKNEYYHNINQTTEDEVKEDIHNAKNQSHQHSSSASPTRKRFGQESPKVISNPWSFFNRSKIDKQESRYQTEQDEIESDRPYSPASVRDISNTGNDLDDAEFETEAQQQDQLPDNQNEQIPENHRSKSFKRSQNQNQALSSFIPTMFSSKTNQENQGNANGLLPEGTVSGNETSFPTDRRLKKLFALLKRKQREPKRLNPSFIPSSNDHAAIERANKLVDALSLACPSINLLASCLCEDEYGIARAPLLLTLLGLKVRDCSPSVSTKNRRLIIDLEYGVGPQRLKWSVAKTAKDLLYLHSRFKIENIKFDLSKTEDLPKLPIPPLRNDRQGAKKRSRSITGSNINTPIDEVLDDPTSNVEDQASLVQASPHQNNTDAQSTHTAHTTLSGHLSNLRAHLSRASSVSTEDLSPEIQHGRKIKNEEYVAQVSNYLHDLIKLLALRPQSNRLFQFFEISPISSLLSYETGYQGKQGVIHVGGTAKSQGWRVGHFKANDLKGMIDRRSEKWLLVRNSYVMYVADINSTLPLEVFLVDHKFKISVKSDLFDTKTLTSGSDSESDYDDASLVQKAINTEETTATNVLNKVFKHLKITLENSERKLVLIPKSTREHKLWLKSLNDMKNSSIWSNSNRFDSFAPIRQNCYAQWFVDARDYFWAVSSAMEMAKDVIFIHDWWLSPELYLRRPANGNQQWRIDRILQRKAQQGVKIFVIVYRNVGTTVSTDSLYTKHSILSLNEENIHVIRSPNQLLQNTYFWAHHEKLCIIDHTVAFLGGIDLCYGRYDTPDHVLVDDSKVDFNALNPESLSPEEFIRFQTFPGKDYSNPRVKDFFGLDKPYESMYDRDSTPRMPWHDVHMLTSGKIARDLSRHFVQRWNYLLRQKRPSRFTPLLTPPPDLSDKEVEEMGLGGTCEVQLLRSSGNWSLGLKQHEQSIQNAYLKLIETSEHFVYIENQFFVTSCFIDGTEIQNRIGDALVDRIIKAHNEGTNWRAVIVIPLMPGFESQVDEPDGSSVRVIMQCQYMSISRGTTSIFAKLKKYGINPDDYIHFFSLRKWGIIGPDRTLVTEQLYIHAKTMIVDDRAAIIGSANINERSMRGVRDSEVAAVVRDKETISTTMNGEPYLAGKFAHTLRMRLMREHIGVSVDTLDIVERRFKRFENFAKTQKGLQAATNNFKNPEHAVMSAMVELASRDILQQPQGTFRWKNFHNSKHKGITAEGTPLDDINEEEKKVTPSPLSLPISFNNRTGQHEANKGIRDKKKHSFDARVQHNDTHKMDVYGEGLDKYHSKLAKKARLNSTRFLKDLAYKSMQENPIGTFLPDTSNVIEFLESDDYEMLDEMDHDSEVIIYERNKERWQLLKKVSYLQRVAAKEKEQKEEEGKKRVATGLPQSSSFETSSNNENINGNATSLAPQIAGTAGSAPDVQTENQKVNNLADTNSQSQDLNDAGAMDKKSIEAVTSDANGDDIPIITLNESSARDVIQEINSRGVQQFNRFIDPYCFEDPLDVEFYEDIWYDNARRNTEIFRTIFHTQPDDTVLSWKDYKQFSKLQRAFILAQAQDSRSRREKFHYDHQSLDEEEIDEESSTHNSNHRRKGSHATINVNKLQNDVGLLGYAPPSSHNGEGSISPQIPRNKFKNRFHKDAINAISEEEPSQNHENDTHVPSVDGDKEELNNGFQTQSPEDESSNSNDTDQTPSYEADKDENDHTGNGITFNAANGKPSADTKTHARRRAGTFGTRRRVYMGERVFERDSAERILNEIHGHLVMFPADWLMRELEGGNWFYNTDRIPPIDIYD